MKGPRKESRYSVQAIGLAHLARRPIRTRWRSRDLKGPLPSRVVNNLLVAIRSLPTHGPWPEIDEEAWWNDVLTDRRLRPSSEKKLHEKNEDARLRLDRLPCKSLTFSCKYCRHEINLTIAELIKAFGSERNIRTIGRDVIKCMDKRARREGDECPIIYRA
jgi:hypothetical protein